MDTTPRIHGIDLLARRGQLGPFQRWRAVHGREAVEVWITPTNGANATILATELERSAGAIHPALWRPRGSGKTLQGDRYVVLSAALPDDLRSLGHGTPLSLPLAFRLVSELGRALRALHAERLIMGALHPSHVRLHLPDDPTGSVSLLPSPLLQVPVLPCAVRTTRHEFLAPEVSSSGHVSAAADQYFLGLVLYAACCGVWPVEASSDAPLPPMAQRAPDVNVAPQADALARRLAFPAPGGRFESLDEAVSEIDRVSQALGVHRTGGRAAATASTRSTSRLVVPVLGAGVVTLTAVLAGLAVTLSSTTTSTPRPNGSSSLSSALTPEPRPEQPAAHEGTPEEAAELRVARPPQAPRPTPRSEPAAPVPEPASEEGTPQEASEPVVLTVAPPQADVEPAQPEPPSAAALFEPEGFTGTYTGSRTGRPFDLILTFEADGTVTGTACVTIGPRQMKNAVQGSWNREGPQMHFQARELQGSRRATYDGTIHASGRASGTWSDGKRASGQWKAQR
ncbi:MAG: hypothetical protein KTR31_05310 [Myxococcales bacterium]|nr:hypothetical protein [Myxococcales bacterium]